MAPTWERPGSIFLHGRVLLGLLATAAALNTNPTKTDEFLTDDSCLLATQFHLVPRTAELSKSSDMTLDHVAIKAALHLLQAGGLVIKTAATSQSFMWLVGIPISLIGSTLTVTGLMIQKMSSELQTEPRPFYCFSWSWIGGLALFFTGNLVTWSALGMAPQSVLSVFNSWNIIFSLVVAPRFFAKENISQRTKYCAGVLVIGCCWVAIAGPKSYRAQTIDHIAKLFSFPAWKIGATCLVVVYIMSLVRYKGVRLQQDWDPVTVAQIAVAAAISASFSTIFSRCTSSLFQTTATSYFGSGSTHNEMHGPFFAYAVITLLCGLSQLHFLNESLRHGDASFVIPLYESTAMAIQIVFGGIVFQEYGHFTWQRHCAFWPGVLIVLGGVVALTKFAAEDRALQGALQKEAAADEAADQVVDKAEDGYAASKLYKAED